ncbi:MAG TPA: TRAP transporter small permease subunit, partial [Burkholderiaceae bacterium]|nr:TRAP transporter small permease subunit [Burkholderiaceae bacterium]
MASVIAERLSRGIAWVCAAILYLTFGAIFCILCSDVVLRYFSGSSLRWASEIPELLFPWLVMAGVVLAAQHGAHIATTFLADAVKGKVRRAIASIGHVAIIGA